MRLGTGFARWLQFNAVGALGIGLQLTLLTLLTEFGVAYLPATALAVEATVLHNFAWHETWTWRDRRCAGGAAVFLRLVRFNASVGAVSLVGNLIGMRILVGWAGVAPAPANLVTLSVLGLLNYLVNDRLVFRAHDRGAKPAAWLLRLRDSCLRGR